MSSPIVLVRSECPDQMPAQTLINRIRSIDESERQCLLEDTSYSGFLHALKTKYYSCDILLCPISDDLATIPPSIVKRIEGLVLYFDAKNRDFLSTLPSYADFLRDNGIEFGLMLCSQLSDEPEGISYKEAKQFSTLLDVIELEGEDSEADDGYEDVAEALQNFIWSNIDMGGGGGASGKNVDEKLKDLSEKDVEEKLVEFEKLISQAMTFRSATADLTRNERLLYAQQFASAFESLIGEGLDSEDEELPSG